MRGVSICTQGGLGEMIRVEVLGEAGPDRVVRSHDGCGVLVGSAIVVLVSSCYVACDNLDSRGHYRWADTCASRFDDNLHDRTARLRRTRPGRD